MTDSFLVVANALRVILVLNVFLAQTAAQTAAQDAPTVTVQQGVLVGTTETFQESQFIGVNKTIDVFKGIPFAELPVGRLRFEPPVAKEPWVGTYDATYFRDACVQDPLQAFGMPMSEDCLHLNIYATRTTFPEGAAVMVYIHSGSLNGGSAVLPDFNGLPLVSVGDVILVTINYRLNVFGFLTTGDEASPGNVGLKDQVMALEWIKQNIAAFGGDKERITIFGVGSGGLSVNLLVLSQQTTGLFSQAIMQSVTALSPSFYEDQELLRQQAFQVGERVGCRVSDSVALLDCLREINATALITAAPQSLFRSAPVLDGTFLDDTPANLYATGRYNHVKLLLGSNKDEGTFNVYLSQQFGEYRTKEQAPIINEEAFDQLVTEKFVRDYGYSNDQLTDAIRMQYIDWSQADNDSYDFFRSYVDFATDFSYACPVDQVARYHAQSGDDVYVYQMTHVPSVSYWNYGGFGPGWLLAGHAEDVQFVFGFPFIPAATALRGELQDDEKALSVKFMEFWTNFANTGNPGVQTPGSPPDPQRDFWPRFTIPELEYKELSLNLTSSRALKSDKCHFWNSYMVQLRTMLADLDVAEREWREAFHTWKYTDLADWRYQFAEYKAINAK
ncbi:cholinesterase 1-like [Patiria miniata]|nr:cholinesterase 1-like [Patiria miniata]